MYKSKFWTNFYPENSREYSLLVYRWKAWKLGVNLYVDRIICEYVWTWSPVPPVQQGHSRSLRASWCSSVQSWGLGRVPPVCWRISPACVTEHLRRHGWTDGVHRLRTASDHEPPPAPAEPASRSCHTTAATRRLKGLKSAYSSSHGNPSQSYEASPATQDHSVTCQPT